MEPLTIIVPGMEARPASTRFDGDSATTPQGSFVLPDVTIPPPGYPFHLERAEELLSSWNLLDGSIEQGPSHDRLASLSHTGALPEYGTFTSPNLDRNNHVWHQWQPYYGPCNAGVEQSQPAPTEPLSGERRRLYDASNVQQNQQPVHPGQCWVPQPYYVAIGSSTERGGSAASTNQGFELGGQSAYSASSGIETNQPTAASEQVWEPLQHYVAMYPGSDQDWLAYWQQLGAQQQLDASSVPGFQQGQPVVPTAFSSGAEQFIADGHGQVYQRADSGTGSTGVPAVQEYHCRWYRTVGATRDAPAVNYGASNGERYGGRHASGGYGSGSRHTSGGYASPVTLWSQLGLCGSSIPRVHPSQGGHGACGCGPDGCTPSGSAEARGYHRAGRGRLSSHRMGGPSRRPQERSSGLSEDPPVSSGLPSNFESDPAFRAEGRHEIERDMIVWRFLDGLPDDFPTPLPDHQPHPVPLAAGNVVRAEHFAYHRGDFSGRGGRRGSVVQRDVRRASGLTQSASSSSSAASSLRGRGGWTHRPNNFQRLDGPSTSTDAQAGSSS